MKIQTPYVSEVLDAKHLDRGLVDRKDADFRERTAHIFFDSRMGEDNDTYYDVKIKAAKIVLDNVDNTFVTPVFNGSASLRDAAGQLINNAARAPGRKQTVDNAFMEKQFADITALFRLDQISAQNRNTFNGKTELGELPATAALLLGAIGTAWVLVLAYVVYGKVREFRRNKK
jgi:multiple sugar transport system substrate-binding protein